MLTHYPIKRSVLVPVLLYVQDELGYLTDEAIEEIAGRLGLTPLEVRNVISYYSMLRDQACRQIQRAGLHQYFCMLRGGEEILEHAKEEAWRGSKQGHHARRRVFRGRGGVHRSLQLGSGHAGELRLPREPYAGKGGRDSRSISNKVSVVALKTGQQPTHAAEN